MSSLTSLAYPLLDHVGLSPRVRQDWGEGEPLPGEVPMTGHIGATVALLQREVDHVLNTDHELDRQREVLLRHDLPHLVGLAEDTFTDAVEALRPELRECVIGDQSQAHAPFVLVVSRGAANAMAAAERLVPLLRLAGGSVPGVLDRNHGEQGLAPYRPIDEVGPPPAPVYALLDVERGEEFCGVAPQDALPVIFGRGRTPLTIPEGIALVLLYPQVLERNACFMLSGSRRGDRRVPALWISGKAPKLGWCWDGNPHAWLGVASARARIAASGHR